MDVFGGPLFCLPCIVSVEKPAVQLIVTPLQVMTLLLIIAFKILSLILAFNSLTMMWLGVISFVFMLLGFF